MKLKDFTLNTLQVLPKYIENSIQLFLDSMDIADNSKNTYLRNLRCFFRWLRINKIDAPTDKHAIKYKEYLIKNRGLKTSTVNAYIITLRKYFQWLETRGQYNNIMLNIKPLRTSKNNLKDALTKDEVTRLLQSIKTHDIEGLRDYAIINLMLRTGLRVVEIVRSNIGDICNYNNKKVLYVQGKGRTAKDEYVVLTPNTLKPIENYLHALRKSTKTHAACVPLFTSLSTKNYGQRLTERSITRIVQKYLVKTGVKSNRITTHSLRHTAITLGLLAGATPQQMMHFARHQDIKTTMVYAHNIDRIKDAPEFKIDDYLN